MSVVITGASGQLGRLTARFVLDAQGADPGDVVLVTRSVGQLSDLADRGAQVRFGDFSDPTTLTEAFDGATRVLIVSTTGHGAQRVAQHRAALAAAKTAGAELVAYTSVPNPDPNGNAAAVVADHAATEQAVIKSGIAYTFLRNALYGEFKIPEAQAAISNGAYSFNTGDGVTTYVSREDCAAAAAAVLTGGAEHAGQTYTITGSELLSGAALAEIYSLAGGREVTPKSVDDATFASHLLASGLPDPAAQAFVSFGQAIRAGAFNQLTDHVQRLTGRAPRSVDALLASAGIGAEVHA